MDNKKVLTIGNYIIELLVPNMNKDLRYSFPNNINIYDTTGRLHWNISDLLKHYSDNNGLKYYEDMYFDIKDIGNEKIFCTGFINHCEIDLQRGLISKIFNNR